MRNFGLRAATALLLLAGTTVIYAMPFGTFDSRSIAMGGTGVASGTGGNAAYFNPALLAAANRKEDRFAFEIMFSGRVADPDKLQDDLDRMKNTGNDLSNALNRFNQTQTQGNARHGAGPVDLRNPSRCGGRRAQ